MVTNEVDDAALARAPRTVDRHHAAQWAPEREDATRDGLGERIESEAALLGILDGGIVEVGHDSARSNQGVVGAQNSVSANDKSVRVATIMAGISLRRQSSGGLGECGHAASGAAERRLWAGPHFRWRRIG